MVGVGGATLGGSGKTPYAIALARALAQAGQGTVLVGHACGASPRRPRIVSPGDDVREVGDDALVAARALEACGIDVVVAPTRQAAVAFAARRGSVLVVDGLLQTRPERLSRSVLVLDGDLPWGAGKHPPLGDLRARPETLLEAADSVAILCDSLEISCPYTFPRPWQIVTSRIAGLRAPDGSRVPLALFEREAFGLLLGVARPGRVIRGLARRGLSPRALVRIADHVLPTRAELDRAARMARGERLRAWLCTPKCSTRLPSEVGGARVLTLDHEVVIPVAGPDWLAVPVPDPGLVAGPGSLPASRQGTARGACSRSPPW